MNEKQEAAYMRAIDESLKEVLGETATQLIYASIEERCKIRKDEIPSRMKEFRKQLEQILGTASKIVEARIDQNMKRNENNIST